MRRNWLLLALTLAIAAVSTTASAQVDRDTNWQRCHDEADAFSADVAIGACTAIIQSGHETTENLATALANRSGEFYRAGDYQRAISDATQALRLVPGQTSALNNRAIAYDASGNQAAALADLNAAIAANPQFGLAHKNRGDIYLTQHDAARAMQEYNAAVQFAPQDARGYVSRGDLYRQQNDNVHAIADYDQALRIKPQSLSALFGRGVARHNTNDFAGAVSDYTAAIAVEPTVMEYRNRGLSYWSLADTAHALADFDEAIRRKPDFLLAYQDRARLRYETENYAGSIADYGEILRAEPQNAGAFGGRGDAYQYGLHDLPHAIADYDQALRLQPSNWAARYNRGFAWSASGDTARGEADYRAALDLIREPPDFNTVCWELAKQGQALDMARTACDRAIAANTESAPEYFDSRGLVGLKQQRDQDAWNDYDAAVRARADQAHYIYGRGIAALRLGRTADGEADIVRARVIDANIPAQYATYGIEPPPAATAPLPPSSPPPQQHRTVAANTPAREPPPAPPPLQPGESSLRPGRHAFAFQCPNNQILRVIFDGDDDTAIVTRIRQPNVTLHEQTGASGEFHFANPNYDLAGTYAAIRFRIGAGEPMTCVHGGG